MNAIEQFLAMLNKMEDGETKTELVTSFETVTGEYNKVKNLRKELGGKLDKALEFKSKVGSLMEFEEDFTIDDVQESINAKLKAGASDDIDKVRNDLTTKYETELSTLRDLNNASDIKYNEMNSKYQMLEHDGLIDKVGLLDKFQDNGLFKQMGREHFRKNTLVVDGNLYLNDGDGTPAKDLKTGEFLAPEHLYSKMKDDVQWQPMLKTEQKANGMNTPQQQANSGQYSQQTQTTHGKISEGLQNL